MSPCSTSGRFAFAGLAVMGALSCDLPPADPNDPSIESTASTSNEPAPAEAAGAPAAVGDTAARDEIRIALSWNQEKSATVWKVGTKSATSEAELERLLQEAADERARSSSPSCPVVIDAVRTVPWRAVVAAMNACSKAGLAKIEFEFGEG